ncbi:MAG: ATP-binding protein [Gammaproteobacteria bacterium]|nr:ATP-binding protein [Gammaproteobacteria bacterium]MDA8014769.1 ATP-binding protein [Gammaproteobacteria bacterium]
MKNIIFLGGIHRVGKSTLARAFCKDSALIHKSAGYLIGSVGADKQVADVSGNQARLIEAVNNLDRTAKYLLDGHFCLWGKDGQIKPIETEVFEKLFLAAVILLQGDVQVIQNRIRELGERNCTVAFLEDFQQKELEQAKKISKTLDIPMRVITLSKIDDDILLVKDFVESVFL